MPLLASPMPNAIEWKFVTLPEIKDEVATIMITGSREYVDLKSVNETLVPYFRAFIEKHPGHDLVLISGHAQRGADVLAEMVWSEYGPVLTVPADWQTHTPERCKCHDTNAEYCRLAGIVRNEKMVDEYKPSVCVAFYSDNSENRGTNHAAEYARSKDVPVRIVREPYIPREPAAHADAAPTAPVETTAVNEAFNSPNENALTF